RPEAGINSDLEIGRFLTEETSFRNSIPLAGALEFAQDSSAPLALALIQPYVRNGGDVWHVTLGALWRYFDEVLRGSGATGAAPPGRPAEPRAPEMSPEAAAMVESYVQTARRLGQRTAELHQALSSSFDNRAFVPEPFTPHYQRSIYQQVRSE